MEILISILIGCIIYFLGYLIGKQKGNSKYNKHIEESTLLSAKIKRFRYLYEKIESLDSAEKYEFKYLDNHFLNISDLLISSNIIGQYRSIKLQMSANRLKEFNNEI